MGSLKGMRKDAKLVEQYHYNIVLLGKSLDYHDAPTVRKIYQIESGSSNSQDSVDTKGVKTLNARLAYEKKNFKATIDTLTI